MKKSMREWATGHGWEKLPNDMRSDMMEVDAQIERLCAELIEARSIIDDLRFHDLSGRADKFMGDNPFQSSKA